MTFPTLLSRASDILHEHRSASVCLLQRKMSLSHGQAMLLLVQLASRGTVGTPNPNGTYRFAFDTKMMLRNKPPERHARLLRDLAVYLLEVGPARDTACLGLLRHAPGDPFKVPPKVLDEVVRGVGGDRPDRVLRLARALGTLPAMQPPADAAEGLEEALVEFCSEVRLPEQAPSSRKERLHAALIRAMRYLDKRLHDGWGPHSRCLELFVPDDLVPQGRGLEGNPTRREHVVPCVLLCAEATWMLERGISAEEVATWIEPYLRIVWLDAKDVDKLDHRLKLKTRMPDDWSFAAGCIYARLHAADIPFEPSAEGPECCGWDIERRVA